jgi:hypothetical protein
LADIFAVLGQPTLIKLTGSDFLLQEIQETDLGLAGMSQGYFFFWFFYSKGITDGSVR